MDWRNKMQVNLKDYQIQCLDSIEDKVNKGAHRLSVIIPAGMGGGYLAMALAERLEHDNENRVAVVFRYTKDLLMWKSKNDFLVNKDNFLSFERWERSDENFKYLIFLRDLPLDKRLAASKKLNGTDSVTFSFSSSLPLSLSDREIVYESCFRTASHDLAGGVFVTSKALDVHDIKYFDEAEIAFTKKWCKLDDQAIEEKIKKRLEELSSYKIKSQRILNNGSEIEADDSPQDPLWKLERENSNLKIQLRDTRGELEQLRSICGELVTNINVLKRRNDYFNAFLSQAGFSQLEFNDSFLKIENMRESLQEELDSSDEYVKEQAQKKLQDEIVCIVGNLVKKVLEKNDWSYFKDALIDELTDRIWTRLKDESKNFLITAKSTFVMMSNKEDGNLYDYSGVCLLITKTLEIEVTKRFLTDYKCYLSSKYKKESDFPKSLQKRNKQKKKMEIIDEEHFTLGEVIHLLGVEYDRDKHHLKWVSSPEKDEFLSYSRECLFDSSRIETDKIENELLLDCEFIEKVRKDYRNPSAHKKALTLIKAQECLNYVVDVQEMLKKMLSVMKI